MFFNEYVLLSKIDMAYFYTNIDNWLGGSCLVVCKDTSNTLGVQTSDNSSSGNFLYRCHVFGGYAVCLFPHTWFVADFAFELWEESF